MQTTLFETVEIEKVEFEMNAQYYLMVGKIIRYEGEEKFEMFVHYKEFNSFLGRACSPDKIDKLLDTIYSFETPEGLYYEMRIKEQLGDSIVINSELLPKTALRLTA